MHFSPTMRSAGKKWDWSRKTLCVSEKSGRVSSSPSPEKSRFVQGAKTSQETRKEGGKERESEIVPFSCISCSSSRRLSRQVGRSPRYGPGKVGRDLLYRGVPNSSHAATISWVFGELVRVRFGNVTGVDWNGHEWTPEDMFFENSA